MTAGIAVCVLGHGHAGLAQAIALQASRLHHTSNLYFIEAQIRLAEALARRAFAGKIFFCNSGTEANEAALKLARRYQIVVRSQPNASSWSLSRAVSTVAPWARSRSPGQAKYREGFGPLVPDVRFMPFGDAEAARRTISERTCAVIAEPIQAEGGINLPPPGYLQELRRLCSERGALLIFDEVQTGVGRTGTFYAFEREAMVPDIVTLAKGLAGGVPMGAMRPTRQSPRPLCPVPTPPPSAATRWPRRRRSTSAGHGRAEPARALP